MNITEEEFISIVKSAYKEGYLDADGDNGKLGHWWKAANAKARLNYQLNREKACIKNAD